MVAVPCRDSSESAGLSPIPDDDEEEEEEEEEGSPEGIDPANNSEGTVTWQQATTRKGQKNKKKKTEGEFVSEGFLTLWICLTVQTVNQSIDV